MPGALGTRRLQSLPEQMAWPWWEDEARYQDARGKASTWSGRGRHQTRGGEGFARQGTSS